MYENLNIFVREDGDTPEDQILGLKTNDKVHSLEKYIQELDFADEMWRELYVLNEQLTRRFINVVDIVRTSSSRSICFTKVSGPAQCYHMNNRLISYNPVAWYRPVCLAPSIL